jgi:4-diphosphocytidyl-2C-methyl-D-erythritol kinase
MRVLHATTAEAEVVYCGAGDTTAEWYPNNHLVVVTDPVKEFSKSSGWLSRLTDEDRKQLRKQCPPRATAFNHEETTNAKENDMAKLFQTKEETPRFGTMLATNSAGKYVLEMKGSGDVLTFEKSEVEEVKPYTVGVRFELNGIEYHYLSRKGDVEKGDILFVSGSGSYAFVTSVDTKSDKATKELTGRKVLTAVIGE